MERVWAPAVDMYETKDDLVVAAELPGVNEKDIHLSITGDLLTVRASGSGTRRSSRRATTAASAGTASSSAPSRLPMPVQADKVKATYRDGVLTITLPKVEEVKPKEIKIDVL